MPLHGFFENLNYSFCLFVQEVLISFIILETVLSLDKYSDVTLQVRFYFLIERKILVYQ